MKIGLGLYQKSMTPDNFQFATEAGATHMTNYFRSKDPAISRGDAAEGWGDYSRCKLSSYEELSALIKTIKAVGLKLAALADAARAAIVLPFQHGGEAAAQDRLAAFLDGRLAEYAQGRDYLAKNASSGLSENLTCREISPVQIWHALQAGAAEAETAPRLGTRTWPLRWGICGRWCRTRMPWSRYWSLAKSLAAE